MEYGNGNIWGNEGLEGELGDDGKEKSNGFISDGY